MKIILMGTGPFAVPAFDAIRQGDDERRDGGDTSAAQWKVSWRSAAGAGARLGG